MALSNSTRLNTRAAIVAAGTSVDPGVAIPDNCHTVIYLNRSSHTVLIGQGTAGGVLADDGTNTVIPANAGLTWEVGTREKRLDDLTDLIYDCDAGSANCDITYLCASGAG